jgi:predicted PurR-regulated permease PerM
MKLSNHIAIGILKSIGVLILGFAILWMLYYLQGVIWYIVFATILTLVGLPVVNFLQRKLKFKRGLAVGVMLLIYIGLLIGFVSMFIPLILAQGESLSLLETNKIESNFRSIFWQIEQFLEKNNFDKSLLDTERLTKSLDFDFIPILLNSAIGAISSFGMGVFSVLFITFFFLKDNALIRITLQTLLPAKQEERILLSVEKTRGLLTRYFVGLFIQLMVVFILYLIVLSVFGVKNALVIAFLCALLNIIPYLGPLIGMVVAAVLTMISNLGLDFQTEMLPTTLYVIIGFFAVQLIDNYVNQPLIFSNSVKSHPLEIFFVILIAGFLFGIIGMIIAVPVYTILKVLGKEFLPNNRFIQTLTRRL